MALPLLSTLLLSLPCLAEPPLAVPVDGGPFPARLASVDAGGKLVFSTAGRERTLAAADLACWGACRETSRGPLVVLADGGVFPADLAGADKENLAVESDLLGELKLPLETLSGIVLRPPADRPQRDLLLDRVARAGGESDRILLDNGDEVTGLIDSIRDGKVRIQAGVGPLTIELRRCVSLVFNPALREKPAAAERLAWLGLADGTRLRIARMHSEGGRLLATGPAGQAWKVDLAEVAFLLPLGGRAVYLSDLKPERYHHEPYLDLAWPYHADRNVTGGLLRCGGRLFLKGLGVHSRATLTYALDGSYRRFQAELGIDDSTGGRGSVEFRILVDGKSAYASGPIRGGAAPVPISIDLSGAKHLELVVDYGEQGDVLDHADWLNARLVK
ncbi:MAG: NPCBM/NEW2 domain-containing protein [Thermoguttaceae bacterium]